MSQVSALGLESLSPRFPRKPRSKEILCPTIGQEPINETRFPATDENGGARSTSDWLIPVYDLMNSLSFLPGLTKVW